MCRVVTGKKMPPCVLLTLSRIFPKPSSLILRTVQIVRLSRGKEEYRLSNGREEAVMGKTLVVGYGSALGYWRAARVAGSGLDEGCPGKVFGARKLSLSEQTQRALSLCKSDRPLDAVIGDRAGHHNCQMIADHIWRGPLQAAHLLNVGSGIMICRPQVVFAQLAASLDEVDLALIACELAGTYGLVPWADEPLATRVSPLLDVAGFRGYASSAKALGVRGSSRALNALELAVDGSNSPRETAVAVILLLTRPYGGYDLPGFVMNQPIELPQELAEFVGAGALRPDFYWPTARLIVEYDSDAYHLNSRQKARDEARRLAFQAAGYELLTLNNEMLTDSDKLDTFMAEVARRLGVRRRMPSAHMLAVRRETCERLFGR